MASGSRKIAAIAALAMIPGLGSCGGGAKQPTPAAADPPPIASARAVQGPPAPPGTYFQQWPDIYGAAAPAEAARERFPEGKEVAAPAAPAAQRPLRALQNR